jgi:cell pole-organizing protein PopZ
MSAANASAPSPSLQDEMRAHEPSMEEILASIRRIISDDQVAPLGRRERETRQRLATEAEAEASGPAVQNAYPAPALDAAPAVDAENAASAAAAEEPAPPPAAVVEIRQLRLHRAAPPPALDADEAQAPEETDEPDIDLDTLETADEAADDEPAQDTLVSDDTASSVASHFQALTASMFLNDSGLLQQYAQEMMRPMLKQWLDDNLPVIVERLVRAEIERVARGGRR